METPRVRRRRSRSRRKARKKQVIALIVVALFVGAGVWTRILILRREDAAVFSNAASTAVEPERDVTPVAVKGRPAATVIPTTASKNLILFVGNGFGMVPITATRIYAVGEAGELAIDKLPSSAMVRTTSRNATTADAAAAMTAYMTGLKVDNEVLSQTADTHPYDDDGRPQSAHGETTCPTAGNGTHATTLLELAKASGRAIGIVTTARVTQPTAAAAFAHLCQRGAENTIAAQLVPSGPGANAAIGEGVDVILGGGWQHFLPKDDPRGSSRSDSRDLFAEMRAKGYTVIGREVELAALGQSNGQPVGKLLGLFGRGEMHYDADRVGTSEPSLSEMTTRAIDLLRKNANGYVLIVEGGRIGDALDASLAQKAVQEGRAFDDAVAAAIEHVHALDPDLRGTTIVVTANHDHTMVMNGNAALDERTGDAHPGVLGVVRSYDQPTLPAVDASGRPYTRLVFGAGPNRVRSARAQAPALADVTLGDRNIRYESAIELPESIGGADVPLAAIGADASRFHGTIDNTQVFGMLREALGL